VATRTCVSAYLWHEPWSISDWPRRVSLAKLEQMTQVRGSTTAELVTSHPSRIPHRAAHDSHMRFRESPEPSAGGRDKVLKQKNQWTCVKDLPKLCRGSDSHHPLQGLERKQLLASQISLAKVGSKVVRKPSMLAATAARGKADSSRRRVPGKSRIVLDSVGPTVIGMRPQLGHRLNHLRCSRASAVTCRFKCRSNSTK